MVREVIPPVYQHVTLIGSSKSFLIKKGICDYVTDLKYKSFGDDLSHFLIPAVL